MSAGGRRRRRPTTRDVAGLTGAGAMLAGGMMVAIAIVVAVGIARGVLTVGMMAAAFAATRGRGEG